MFLKLDLLCCLEIKLFHPFCALSSASVADFVSYSAVQPVEMKFPSSLKLADVKFGRGHLKEECRPCPLLAAIYPPPALGMHDGEEHCDPFQLNSWCYTTDVFRVCATLKFSLITVLCWRPRICRCTCVCMCTHARTHGGIYGDSSVFHHSNCYQVFKWNRAAASLLSIQQQDKSSVHPPCKST